MFDDSKRRLNGSRSDFLDKVNDAFSESISNDVFGAIEGQINFMDAVWTESELKAAAIRAMLTELKLIL